MGDFFQMAMEGDQVVEEVIHTEDDEVDMPLTNHTERKGFFGDIELYLLMQLPSSEIVKINLDLQF